MTGARVEKERERKEEGGERTAKRAHLSIGSPLLRRYIREKKKKTKKTKKKENLRARRKSVSKQGEGGPGVEKRAREEHMRGRVESGSARDTV